MHRAQTKTPGFSMGDLLGEVEEEEEVLIMKEGIVNMKGVVTKKKYKPVPKNIRDIKGDPLENMPDLEKVPLPFTPKGCYTTDSVAMAQPRFFQIMDTVFQIKLPLF